MTTTQHCCIRCGTCCRQGGPALHHQDLGLLSSGRIPTTSLITIRKDELVHDPVTGKVQPVQVELVKITGTGRQWTCLYYNEDMGCTLYEDRPQACRVLKCWDTEAILALAARETLCRCDILPEKHRLLSAIEEHERLFPCRFLAEVFSCRDQISTGSRNDLGKLINDEMQFRGQVVAQFQLSMKEELFYFGRPLFQLMQALGVRVSESSKGLQLHWS